MKTKFIYLLDIILNVFFSKKYQLIYIVESADWSIRWDGKYITKNINESTPIKSRISTTSIGLRKKIIHFGSVNTFISENGIKNIHKSNKIVLTWFHVSPNDPRVKFIPELNKKIDIAHTSCTTTKAKLINFGLSEEKITVVPLGVDLDLFKPAIDNDARKKVRKEHNIPENKILIGSFQKDGVGWSDGNVPKLIKGPDIFCDVIEKIATKFPLHILLTGPARGYVINRLDKANIAFNHIFFKKYTDIVHFYQILDYYLICSREEGGPKALLESMACGIPVISTPVGMVPDVVINGFNGYVVGNDDIENKIIDIIENNNNQKVIENAFGDIKQYDWKIIAKRYYTELYEKILSS